MFVLLRFVSGVPPTEAAMLGSRGAAFARYQGAGGGEVWGVSHYRLKRP